MNFIVCIDDNKGLMFNNKRLSRDSKIIEDINNNYSKVVINEYSNMLFQNNGIISSVPTITKKYQFIENNDLSNQSINNLIIYKFNRSYPSDLKLNVNFTTLELISTIEFIGSSHDKITKEVWRKK